MLSGRGPSVLGDFMPPGQDQPVDSAEIQQQQQQQGPGSAAGGQRGAAQQQAQAGERAGGQQAGRHPPRRRQVDSNIGAIVVGEGKRLGMCASGCVWLFMLSRDGGLSCCTLCHRPDHHLAATA